jgi:hypothetical protein
VIAQREQPPSSLPSSRYTYNDETVEELEVIQGEIDALVEEMLSGGSPFSDAR